MCVSVLMHEGFGGTVKEGHTVSSLAKRRTKENLRSITVSFNSDVRYAFIKLL